MKAKLITVQWAPAAGHRNARHGARRRRRDDGCATWNGATMNRAENIGANITRELAARITTATSRAMWPVPVPERRLSLELPVSQDYDRDGVSIILRGRTTDRNR